MNSQIATAGRPDRDAVVTKAFFRAANLLELNQKEIGHILGCSAPTISRMFSKNQSLSLLNKEGEIALIFLRIFRSLDSLFGGHGNDMRLWFNSHNDYLRGVPRELIKTIGGLMGVAEYLDAMRGKI